MPYVDPARVRMALRYAELAKGSPVDREMTTEDLTVFLASLWADATAQGRALYTAAVGRTSADLPWAAVTQPDEPGTLLHGPAVVELLIGQSDPGDEGVPDHRLMIGDPDAEQVVDALYSWSVDLLRRRAVPAGWRMGAEPRVIRVSRGSAPKEELDPEPEGGQSPEEGEQPPEPELAPEPAPPKDTAGTPWKIGALAAGFAVAGLAVWRWG